MDETETRARKILDHLGLTGVLFEPDGNIPPDFSAGDEIAIEVRRLNQNYVDSHGYAGLETVSIPIWNRLETLFATYGPSKSDYSWLVSHTFSRPLPRWNTIKRRIKAVLDEIFQNEDFDGGNISVSENLELDFAKAELDGGQYFENAMQSDRDSGGWVLHKFEKNIKLALQEKSIKVKKYRDRYPEWWLLLEDHVMYGLKGRDIELFQSTEIDLGIFDRLLIYAPTLGSSVWEYAPSQGRFAKVNRDN